MRKQLSIKAMGLAIILTMANFSLMAQHTGSKTVSKAFKCTSSSIVEINNRYGDINIETWDKDSVEVDIKITVTEKTMGKLHDKLRTVNFNLTQSGQFIVINAIFGGQSNVILNEFNRLKENIGMGDSRVEIFMKVKMPDNLNLRVSNKYGNVYLNNYRGSLNVDMGNGKLIAQALSGNTQLKLAFGDAIIQSVNVANMEINFGKLNLTEAQSLRINSRTSDISIHQVQQLNISSSRDSYQLRNVEQLDVDANWTDFNIESIKKKAMLRMNYGVLIVDNINQSIERLYVDARSTKITCFVDSASDLVFDIIANRELRMPMDARLIQKEALAGEEKLIRYQGRTGNGTGSAANPVLIMKTSSADINLIKR